MTADQIREFAKNADWDGYFDQQKMAIFAEIAAQLAEMNTHLALIAHPPETVVNEERP